LFRVSRTTKDLNVLQVELRSKEVHIIGGLILAVYIGVSDNGDQEVHQDDEKKNYIHNEEHKPDQQDHGTAENPIVVIVPVFVTWSCNITKGVSEGLNEVNRELIKTFVISLIHVDVIYTNNLISGGDHDDNESQECNEGSDIHKTCLEEGNKFSDRFILSEEGEYL